MKFKFGGFHYVNPKEHLYLHNLWYDIKGIFLGIFTWWLYIGVLEPWFKDMIRGVFSDESYALKDVLINECLVFAILVTVFCFEQYDWYRQEVYIYSFYDMKNTLKCAIEPLFVTFFSVSSVLFYIMRNVIQEYVIQSNGLNHDQIIDAYFKFVRYSLFKGGCIFVFYLVIKTVWVYSYTICKIPKSELTTEDALILVIMEDDDRVNVTINLEDEKIVFAHNGDLVVVAKWTLQRKVVKKEKVLFTQFTKDNGEQLKIGWNGNKWALVPEVEPI